MRYAIGIALLIGTFVVLGVLLGTPQRAQSPLIPPTLTGGGPANGDTGIPTDYTVSFVDDNALTPASAVATTWHAMHNSSGVNGINGIHFTSANVGYFSGDSNQLMMTIDGGMTWSHVAISGKEQDRSRFAFSDASTGWLVGNGGFILKTTDGLAWSSQTSGTSNALNDVAAVGSTAYAVGGSGTILKTTDGGTTWTAQTSGTSNGLKGITCSTATACIVVGSGASGTILTTSDGGTTWTARTSGTTSVLFDVVCSGSVCLTVGTSGTILRSTDSGATWSAVTSGTSNGLNEVVLGTASTGWAVGANGVILKTTDTGTSWTAQTSGTSKDLLTLTAVDANTALAAGETGVVLRTTNGGSAWAIVRDTGDLTEHGFTAMTFPSATVGWVAGGTSATAGGYLAKTTNGGKVWTVQVSGLNDAFEGISCADTSTCVAVGRSGMIRATTNGGTTWTAQTSGTSNDLFAVQCSNASTCYAFGASGTILKTTNGGTTWTAQTSGTSFTFRGASCVSAASCFAVGDDAVFGTTDGATWSQSLASTTRTFYGIHCPSASVCAAVGASGTIYTTANGGTSWTSRTTGTTSDFNAVVFTSTDNGWAVGNSNAIFRTNNGGTSWTAQSRASGVVSGTNLRAIAAADATTLWASAWRDAIILQPNFNVLLRQNSGNTQNGTAAGPNLCARIVVSNSNRTLTCAYSAMPDRTWFTLTGVSGANGILASDGTARDADVTRSFYVEDTGAVTTDTTPPAPPTNIVLVVSNFGDVYDFNNAQYIPAKLTFTWTNPTDTDLQSIRFLEYIGSSAAAGLLGDAFVSRQPERRFVFNTSLILGTRYEFEAQAVDTSGNRSPGVRIVFSMPTEDPGPETVTFTVTSGQPPVRRVVPPTPTTPTTPTPTTPTTPTPTTPTTPISSTTPATPIFPTNIPTDILPEGFDVASTAPCGLSWVATKWIAESFKKFLGRSPTLTPSDLDFICALNIDVRGEQSIAERFPQFRNVIAEDLARSEFVDFFGRTPGIGYDGVQLPDDLAARDKRAYEYFLYAPKLKLTRVDIATERRCLQQFVTQDISMVDPVTGARVTKPAGEGPNDSMDYRFIRACRYSGALLPLPSDALLPLP